MKKVSLLVVMVLTLFLSCEKEKETQLGEGIQIRIENTSSYTYKDVLVKLSEDRHYGTLAPGEKSAYQTFTTAYRYAYVELKIGDKTYVLQPIDYVGEEELKEGKYTYQISADNGSDQYGRLGLTFKED